MLGQSRQRQLIDKRSPQRGKNITNTVSKFATQKRLHGHWATGFVYGATTSIFYVAKDGGLLRPSSQQLIEDVNVTRQTWGSTIPLVFENKLPVCVWDRFSPLRPNSAIAAWIVRLSHKHTPPLAFGKLDTHMHSTVVGME